ncbi:MAG: right-handed parallel beta-helix repeat-containing protein, partial [Planctomycetota bacterium]
VRIQDGIEAARDGDTVLVLPGRYVERLDFLGKAITVRSDGDGDPSTHDLSTEALVDGNREIPVLVFFIAREKRDSVLEGFTIANGWQIGIWCEGSSPTIRHNVIGPGRFTKAIHSHSASRPLIAENTITGNGTGVSSDTSTIVGNHVEGNAVAIFCSRSQVLRNTIVDGGGIEAFGSSTVMGNIVSGTSGSGIYCANGTVIGNIISQSKTWGGGVRVEGPALVVDNLIIGNRGNNGAGIFVHAFSTAIIRNNRIRNNTADQSGGGIYLDYRAKPLIEGNTLAGNSAGSGGGIACGKLCETTIQGNTIAGNSAASGAGIYCREDTRVSIRHNVISSNRASARGGGIMSASRIIGMIEANEFSVNEAEQEGGAISCDYARDLRIMANHFRENTAGVGGAVHLFGGNAVIERNEFSLNEAEEGGAIYGIRDATLGLAGSVFLENGAGAYGGGIHVDDCVLSLRNNTFTRNKAGAGGGGLPCFNASQVTLVSEILWKNVATTGQEIYIGAEPACARLAVSYSDLDLDHVFVHPGCTLDVGPGMIDTDPLFIDADAGDVGLLRESECIDAADPTDVPCDASI